MPVSPWLLSLLHREENMSTTIIDQPAGPMHRCGKVWEGLRSLGTSGIGKVNIWRRHRSECAGAVAGSDHRNSQRPSCQGITQGSASILRPARYGRCEDSGLRQKWGVDITTIEAQAPALADLHDLCVPDKQIPAGLKLLAGLLGTILSLVLLGAASGLVHAGHDWVIRLDRPVAAITIDSIYLEKPNGKHGCCGSCLRLRQDFGLPCLPANSAIKARPVSFLSTEAAHERICRSLMSGCAKPREHRRSRRHSWFDYRRLPALAGQYTCNGYAMCSVKTDWPKGRTVGTEVKM